MRQQASRAEHNRESSISRTEKIVAMDVWKVTTWLGQTHEGVTTAGKLSPIDC